MATLTRLLGDIELAEEAAQGAIAVAVQKWTEALPPQSQRANRHQPAKGRGNTSPSGELSVIWRNRSWHVRWK